MNTFFIINNMYQLYYSIISYKRDMDIHFIQIICFRSAKNNSHKTHNKFQLSMLDEQCEKLAYDQLLSYVNLLKTTKPLKLTFDQAQSLTTKQLGSLALSKEQSKACGGAETAQVRLNNYTSLEKSWPTISQAW